MAVRQLRLLVRDLYRGRGLLALVDGPAGVRHLRTENGRRTGPGDCLGRLGSRAGGLSVWTVGQQYAGSLPSSGAAAHDRVGTGRLLVRGGSRGVATGTRLFFCSP